MFTQLKPHKLSFGASVYNCKSPTRPQALGTNEQASLTKWITSAINAELQGYDTNTLNPLHVPHIHTVNAHHTPHSPSSTEHVYYGVKALAALGTDPTKTITKAPLCTAVDTAPHGTIQQALYAASLAATFSCNANALYKDAEALAHAALADPTSVDDTHAAVALLAALKGAGVKVKAPSLTALPGLYKELTHSTGLLRPAKDVKLPTFAATGYAYATVAMAKSVFGGIAAGDLEKNIAQVGGWVGGLCVHNYLKRACLHELIPLDPLFPLFPAPPPIFFPLQFSHITP